MNCIIRDKGLRMVVLAPNAVVRLCFVAGAMLSCVDASLSQPTDTTRAYERAVDCSVKMILLAAEAGKAGDTKLRDRVMRESERQFSIALNAGRQLGKAETAVRTELRARIRSFARTYARAGGRTITAYLRQCAIPGP